MEKLGIGVSDERDGESRVWLRGLEFRERKKYLLLCEKEKTVLIVALLIKERYQWVRRETVTVAYGFWE